MAKQQKKQPEIKLPVALRNRIHRIALADDRSFSTIVAEFTKAGLEEWRSGPTRERMRQMTAKVERQAKEIEEMRVAMALLEEQVRQAREVGGYGFECDDPRKRTVRQGLIARLPSNAIKTTTAELR